MSTDIDLKVGFIGLGDMGGPMAVNLAKAGIDLTVFDLRDEAMSTAERHGARRAASVGDVANSVDLVCTCVLYDHQVREIFLGEEGIIATAKPGLVAIVHSTVYPELVLEIAEAADRRGVVFIDAPVCGGRDRSRTGELTVMAGASKEAFAAAEPVFNIVGSNVFHVGDVGAGQVVKLGNNIMGLVNALVAMEAVRFVNAYGVDTADLFKVAMVSSGASRAVQNYSLHDRYRDEHTLAGTPELPYRMAKDLRYAIAAAQERSTNLPIVALCSQLSPGMYQERWATTPSPEPIVNPLNTERA